MKRTSISEFARLIYQRDGEVDLFELHDRFQLGPAEILRLARLFERLHLIKLGENGIVHIEKNARKWVWENRQKLFLHGQRPWSEVSFEMQSPSTPYLPDLSKVDKSFFLGKVDKRDRAS